MLTDYTSLCWIFMLLLKTLFMVRLGLDIRTTWFHFGSKNLVLSLPKCPNASLKMSSGFSLTDVETQSCTEFSLSLSGLASISSCRNNIDMDSTYLWFAVYSGNWAGSWHLQTRVASACLYKRTEQEGSHMNVRMGIKTLVWQDQFILHNVGRQNKTWTWLIII